MNTAKIALNPRSPPPFLVCVYTGSLSCFLALQAVSGLDSLLWHGPPIAPVFVGHSYSFWATITPGHLGGRTDRSKVLWLNWCPSPTAGRLVRLQKMASSGFTSPITRGLDWGHPWGFQGVSTALGIPVVFLNTGLWRSFHPSSIIFPETQMQELCCRCLNWGWAACNLLISSSSLICCKARSLW